MHSSRMLNDAVDDVDDEDVAEEEAAVAARRRRVWSITPRVTDITQTRTSLERKRKAR